ncbi:hypothetical protein TSOC_011853 [Tetrabaena socialis]|uniref:Uncharacterized protein n=1 Tax=Tetrabaena socialis TaxID=47790 RepID=A0A2J7ZPI7_9CHLO|nr:hypothetical protein TSOC_011853 [Tetrabaena socialis]|eukprot:PNH02185.1 hypothetical protein TSOC_011853 [Tetrabaena socialis]
MTAALEEHKASPSRGRGKETEAERIDGFPRPPSFAAFQARRQLPTDALAVLLVAAGMAAVIVKADMEGGAADGPTGRSALATSPRSSRLSFQLLHVLRHAPHYFLLRPAAAGDWAWVGLSGAMAAYAGLLAALALSPRGGGLWARWCRRREPVLLLAFRVGRTLMHLLSYATLPPHAWHTSYMASYSLSVCRQPLVGALLLALFDQMFKVRDACWVRRCGACGGPLHLGCNSARAAACGRKPLPGAEQGHLSRLKMGLHALSLGAKSGMLELPASLEGRVQVRFLAGLPATALHAASTVLLSYAVVPRILMSHCSAVKNGGEPTTDPRLNTGPPGTGTCAAAAAAAAADAAAPGELQGQRWTLVDRDWCEAAAGGGAGPGRLLSCRTIVQQAVAVCCMLAIPAALSWATERGARRAHRRLCERMQRARSQQEQQVQQVQQAQVQHAMCGGPTEWTAGPTTEAAAEAAGAAAAAEETKKAAEAQAVAESGRAAAGMNAGVPGQARDAVPLKGVVLQESGRPVVQPAAGEAAAAGGAAAPKTVALQERVQQGPAVGVLRVTPRLGLAPRLPAATAAAASCAAFRGASALAYRGVTKLQCVSAKVLSHPGSFAQYSRRLAAAAPALLAAAAESAAAGNGSPPALPHAVSVRGCVQLIAWARSLRPSPAGDATGAGGASASTAPAAPLPQPELARLLPDWGRTGGVSVQELPPPLQPHHVPPPGQRPGFAGAPAAPSTAQQRIGPQWPAEPAAPVRLLGMSPPALALPPPPSPPSSPLLLPATEMLSSPLPQLPLLGAAQALAASSSPAAAAGAWSPPPPLPPQGRAVRLRLESPRAQRARLLVLRGGGDGGSGGDVVGVEVAEAPAVVVAEVLLELRAGVQEVVVEVPWTAPRAQAPAGALHKNATAPDGGGQLPDVLQLVLVPPPGDHSEKAGDGAAGGSGGGDMGGAAGDGSGAGGDGGGGTSPEVRQQEQPLLLHFAVRLLLLPPAAAAEVGALWREVLLLEQGGAEAEAAEAEEGSAACWADHFQPLLEDLAFVAEAERAAAAGGAATDGAAAATAAACRTVAVDGLLPYLGPRGMDATAAAVARCCEASAGVGRSEVGAAEGPKAAAAEVEVEVVACCCEAPAAAAAVVSLAGPAVGPAVSAAAVGLGSLGYGMLGGDDGDDDGSVVIGGGGRDRGGGGDGSKGGCDDAVLLGGEEEHEEDRTHPTSPHPTITPAPAATPATACNPATRPDGHASLVPAPGSGSSNGRLVALPAALLRRLWPAGRLARTWHAA